MPADATELKRRVIKYLEAGSTVSAAMAKVDRSPKTYENWRRADADFAAAATHARELHNDRRLGNTTEVPDFPEFCATYLRQPLYTHQLQWYDVIEGRTPRDLHWAETYIPAEEDHILVNTPVEHAKSTTLTVNYVTWRIIQDANIRVLIVSKTQTMAKKFLYAIKSRLTHPAYRDLQLKFAPLEGWKNTADVWREDMIYIGADKRDSGEKDPTVQALGIGGHIYGARADLIIIDDGVAIDNAHDFEKQVTWIEQEVETRLSSSGSLMLIGTRVAPFDLYGEIQKPDRYVEGECPWTVLTQPAVLDFGEGDDPAGWTTLWPASQEPCKCKRFCNRGEVEPDANGNYPKWDGSHLGKVRATKSTRTWSMVYMQQAVADDAVFSAAAVTGAVDNRRQPGPMQIGGLGHRAEGMNGLYVIGGLDPASSGHTAAVVLAVDRASQQRYVLDVFDKPYVTPEGLRELIKKFTYTYGIHEWRIEKNAFQIMLTQDREINAFLASRGCLLREHYTGRNKWDVDFGVASMSQLFGHSRSGVSAKGGLQTVIEGCMISLPAVKRSQACKSLVEQLITWAPQTKNRTDIVMALWFAEIRAREVVGRKISQTHVPNKYLGKRGLSRRMVINLDEAFADARDQSIA